MSEYRVNLDIYNGPLDLLLYLIRREEVDIYDIPIVRITEQYLKYVELLKQLDPNLAGEFLVLAATMIEIKTRMLLPVAPAEEGGEDLQIDPRADLVRQLLEYKAFKDAAGDLAEAAGQQALKFTRQPVKDVHAKDDELDLEDVQIWDLFNAFSGLMESIGHRITHQEIIYDDTPVELHATDILDRLEREGAMTFSRIFEGRSARSEILGLFLALLELIRRKRILVTQQGNFGEIDIHLNPDSPADQDDPEKQASADESAPEPQTTPEGSADEGQYVPESRNLSGQDDAEVMET
ncbi:MAG: segregation/condensation protein A [Planctomycetota bacterium]|nr:segregation/condensation protein A [Planctomycetota bacterium]